MPLVDNCPIHRIDRALDLRDGIPVQEFDGSRLETVDYFTAPADEFIAQYEKLFTLGHLILQVMGNSPGYGPRAAMSRLVELRYHKPSAGTFSLVAYISR
jgi:hypothetical protein